MNLVFVYGTLKRGFQNHSPYMDGLPFKGRHRTVEMFPLVTFGEWLTPCLMNDPGKGHRVWGELFEVPHDRLPAMDHLEECHLPDGYRRLTTHIEPEAGGEPFEAFVYLRAPHFVVDIRSAPVEEYHFDATYVAPALRYAIR
ncbi:MAG: gamma-glutamylcyclotransferase [Alphaproteobacteria bacterium]|nr:gamma-glutamylcyclotransferase [Alphaproteobacteria bacterium]